MCIRDRGNRDVKVQEPYVLAAVGMYENQWRRFNKHLMGMKTNIARKYDETIRQDQLEVKANLLTKPIARKDNVFFKHLTDDNITHISNQYYAQLEYARMDVIAVVIDKSALTDGTTREFMHSKAYEMLLEPIQHHMGNKYRKHNALIIMDDTGANLNRRIASMHSRLIGIGNENMNFRNIIEYPFFASSELSNGVQLADLVAYSLYFVFKHNKPTYPYLDKIVPRVTRRADEPNILTGLKIWPPSQSFESTLHGIQAQLSDRGDNDVRLGKPYPAHREHPTSHK